MLLLLPPLLLTTTKWLAVYNPTAAHISSLSATHCAVIIPLALGHIITEGLVVMMMIVQREHAAAAGGAAIPKP